MISANKISLPHGQATLKKNTTMTTDINKSALCCIASLAFSFFRDPERKNQSVLFRRVEWTSVLKGFFLLLFLYRGSAK